MGCNDPLRLPPLTEKERKKASKGRLDDPWWEVRLLHETLYLAWKRSA